MIFVFLILITGISEAKQAERIGENETGKIYVYTSLSWNPDVPDSPKNATFTISGPDTYSGNGSFLYKQDVPAGTYTINYGSVNGYETPASETKILTAGDSITFSAGYNYILKKKAGESLDFGDGHILQIKQIDPEKNEVSMELQLDGRIIDEKRLKENDSYFVQKRSFSVNESKKPSGSTIIIGNIVRDADGDYTDIYIEAETPGVMYSIKPYVSLFIISNPEGADINFDEEYKGKTSKKIEITEMEKTHSIRLELKGYENWDGKYKVNPLKEEFKEKIEVSLNKTPFFILSEGGNFYFENMMNKY